jgi:hypothetical protein
VGWWSRWASAAGTTGRGHMAVVRFGFGGGRYLVRAGNGGGRGIGARVFFSVWIVLDVEAIKIDIFYTVNY